MYRQYYNNSQIKTTVYQLHLHKINPREKAYKHGAPGEEPFNKTSM
jgi:hypothetical protein